MQDRPVKRKKEFLLSGNFTTLSLFCPFQKPNPFCCCRIDFHHKSVKLYSSGGLISGKFLIGNPFVVADRQTSSLQRRQRGFESSTSSKLGKIPNTTMMNAFTIYHFKFLLPNTQSPFGCGVGGSESISPGSENDKSNKSTFISSNHSDRDL